jgi:hypothetical protein
LALRNRVKASRTSAGVQGLIEALREAFGDFFAAAAGFGFFGGLRVIFAMIMYT